MTIKNLRAGVLDFQSSIVNHPIVNSAARACCSAWPSAAASIPRSSAVSSAAGRAREHRPAAACANITIVGALTQLATLSETDRVLLLHRHKGLLQRVAERCRVHPSLVSRVFHGRAHSARVERELDKALGKLRTSAARPAEPSGWPTTASSTPASSWHWTATAWSPAATTPKRCTRPPDAPAFSPSSATSTRRDRCCSGSLWPIARDRAGRALHTTPRTGTPPCSTPAGCFCCGCWP